MPATTLTFVVASRSVESARCLPSIARQRYPAEHIEVLVAIGDNPSAQRNAAVARASGEIVYFVDDDSELDPDCAARIVDALREHPELGGVGGPSLGHASDTLLQRSIAIALGSMFGGGPVRDRFRAVGAPREASELELIACNLALRRSLLLRVAGFDPRLYPNEENELLARLARCGARFRFDPRAIVRRSPRSSLRELAVQHFRYGAGRAHNLKLSQRVRHPLLIALPLALFPAPIYLPVLGAAAAISAASAERDRAATFAALLGVYPAIHFPYALGLVFGALRPVRERPVSPIAVYRVKAMSAPFQGDDARRSAPLD